MRLIEINKNLNRHLPKGNDTLKKAMRYSVLSGGKRIRYILAVESCRACGYNKAIVPLACAIEFMHTYSLIHDDLPAMDDDDFRRGKRACHKVFGEANAILAGDALFTLAFNIIANHTEPKIGLKIIKVISDALGADGMALGQALDLEFKNKKKNKNILKRINLLKTAKLFEAAAAAGALVAGGRSRDVAALKRFGLYFGLSFQMVDDYLDGEGASPDEAEILIEKAKRELEIFGKRADILKKISDSILDRTK